MLGASPGRVRREIDLPIVGRALAVAAGFAFAISLGVRRDRLSGSPGHPDVTVAIFRFLGRPGDQRCTGVRARCRAHGDRDLDLCGRASPRWAWLGLMLRAEEVTVRFGESAALAGVTLEVTRRGRGRARCQWVKSTLLRVIAGLQRPAQGVSSTVRISRRCHLIAEGSGSSSRSTCCFTTWT